MWSTEAALPLGWLRVVFAGTITYDPYEVGKQHIGNGETLADDPAFAKVPDSARALDDPGCDEAAGWPDYRRLLSTLAQEDWKDAAALGFEFFHQQNLMQAKLLDEAAKHCLLGVVATLFLLARYTLEEDQQWESSAYLTRTLDGYAASIHPDKFDNATAHGERWPVTDADISRLRRRLMTLSANRTHSTWRNSAGDTYTGNAFSLLPEDHIEPGVRLVDAFSVYVYDVDEFPELGTLAKGAGFCHDNQWGFEVALHDWFLACPCRTHDPELADFFFVPHYTACHLNVETFSEIESDALFRALVPALPHFRRTGGRDHIFVWGGGFAADGPFRSWRRVIPDSIFLTTEPELWNPYSDIDTPMFSPWKDILIPGYLSLHEIVNAAKAAPSMADRPYLADFVGWNRPLHRAQGGADGSPSPRGSLLALAAEPDLHIRQDVPYAEAARGAMSSRFCFVPRGKSAWSSRFFRVLFSGCVPVLVNDFYDPPFDALIDVSSFLVRWPMRKVGKKLLQVLREVSPDALLAMLRSAADVRCWYVYPPSVADFEHVDLQKGKLDAVCPQWRRENAFTAIAQLLRRRRRATRLPSAGAAFHVPGARGMPVVLTDEDCTVE